MNIIKKLLFPLFSIFLLYRSIELVKQLISTKQYEHSGLELFIIAFLLTLFITGIFAFMGFAYPTNKLLPKSYYVIKNKKRLNQLYEIMAVKYFKVMLLVLFWGRKENRKKYFDGTKNGIENFIYQTKQSEFGHIGAFITILIISIIIIINGFILLTIFVTLINIIGNLYPVILQRYHRLRVEKLQKLRGI